MPNAMPQWNMPNAIPQQSMPNAMPQWNMPNGMSASAMLPPVFADSAACGPDMISYEADGPESDPQDRGVCYRYCVPRGVCDEMFQIPVIEGDCKSNGYTQISPKIDSMERDMEIDITEIEGPCKGITLTKFQRPDAAMWQEK